MGTLTDVRTSAAPAPHWGGGKIMALAKKAAAAVLGLNKGKMGGRYPWPF
jgi:hypothetical protein